MFRNLNKVIRAIVIADFFNNSAFASFGPVFAVFVTNQIVGGSVMAAGFATAIYWIVKSVLQLPIARFLDKTDGENDDFWVMFIGYFLGGFVPISYIFIDRIWQLYVIQAVFGVIMSAVVPAWYGVFTRHLDKGRVSFEWSLESVFSVGIATASAAALGGYAAEKLGFKTVFLAAGLVSVASSFLLLLIKRDLCSHNIKENKIPAVPERTTR